MLIQIARAVSLRLMNAEVQSLNPGEIYEVAPAIGEVLIGDGWATPVVAERRDLWNEAPAGDSAFDDGPAEISGS